MRCEDREWGNEEGPWMRLTMFQAVEKVTPSASRKWVG
jgi:hypothetical protein